MEFSAHEKFADNADDYLDQHNIYDLFSHLLKQLAIHRPKDPYSFMLDILDQPVNTRKIIVVGPPGCDKETYVQNIVAEFGVVKLRMDTMLREEIESKSPLGDKIRGFQEKKTEVPDDIKTITLVTRIGKPDCVNQGWVLDGYPTTRWQAQSLQMEGVLCNKFVLFCCDRETAIANAKSSDLFVDFTVDQLDEMFTEFDRHVKQYADLFTDTRALFSVEESNESLWGEVKHFLNKTPISNAPRRPMRVLVLGPRGCGKAKQCIRLSNKYGLVHISIGALLRKEMSRSKVIKEQLTPFIENGALVPDDMIIPIVIQRLLQHDCKSSGWLLDGYPRTLEQAESLGKVGLSPNRCIMMELTKATTLYRCTAVREDPQTGNIYNLNVATPPPIIFNRLKQRNRDTQAVVESLLISYMNTCDDIATKYGKIVKKFNANLGPDQLFAELEHFLLSSLGSYSSLVDA